MHVERRKVGRPVSPEEAKKGLEERTVEVSATVERPVVSKEARVVEEVAVGKPRASVRRSSATPYAAAKSRWRTRRARTRKPPADRQG